MLQVIFKYGEGGREGGREGGTVHNCCSIPPHVNYVSFPKILH